MLKNDFIPVAIDQFNQRQQRDAEGDFYRKIAKQGPRADFTKTTQGRYVCTATGKLLAYNNNRGPDKIKRLMQESLESYKSESLTGAVPIASSERDERFTIQPPKDGLILRVHTKVLGGYEPRTDWTSTFVTATGRDNVWLTKDEVSAIAAVAGHGGTFSAKLARRFARWHFIDNTRGEPHRWSNEEVRQIDIRVDKQGLLSGSVHLETDDGKQGFKAELLGRVKSSQNENGAAMITQFDVVVKGEFWGQGRFTHHGPKGKFPLAIGFRIADGSDPSDKIPPYGTKGWAGAYFE